MGVIYNIHLKDLRLFTHTRKHKTCTHTHTPGARHSRAAVRLWRQAGGAKARALLWQHQVS